MRVLVCGGRNFARLEYNPDSTLKRYGDGYEQYKFVYDTLTEMSMYDWPHTKEDQYGNYLPDVTIISGEADGVDSVAMDWAVCNWTDYEGFPADWDKHGKKAGVLRNIQMLEEGKPDLVVAFPGGRGTAHMVQIAKAAGVEVIEVQYV